MKGASSGGLPPSVDVVQLAALVAPLLARDDAEAIAQQVSERVVEQLRPFVERIEAAARVERRALGPYVPPPTSTTN